MRILSFFNRLKSFKIKAIFFILVSFLKHVYTLFREYVIYIENLKIKLKEMHKMTLEFTHKPNYYLYAQLIIRHIEGYIKKHPDANNAIFDLRDIYQIFREDLPSTTTNLDAILNIADEYTVDTLSGDQKIISHYKIDATNNSLLIDFNTDALTSLKEGKRIIEPDATNYQ